MSEIANTRETEEAREALDRVTPYDYTEMKADALALFMLGHGSRQARRILNQKYPANIVSSRSIRRWFADYSDEVKDAVSKKREMSVLVALEAEGDWVEDVSDDILSFAIPSLMTDLKEDKFNDLPLKDKLDVVTKEINAKSQRNDRKIQRTDPALAAQPPIMAFINLAKQKHAKKEENGTTSDPIIIDVAPDEG